MFTIYRYASPNQIEIEPITVKAQLVIPRCLIAEHDDKTDCLDPPSPRCRHRHTLHTNPWERASDSLHTVCTPSSAVGLTFPTPLQVGQGGHEQGQAHRSPALQVADTGTTLHPLLSPNARVTTRRLHDLLSPPPPSHTHTHTPPSPKRRSIGSLTMQQNWSRNGNSAQNNVLQIVTNSLVTCCHNLQAVFHLTRKEHGEGSANTLTCGKRSLSDSSAEESVSPRPMLLI
jgi:hypothetical protein